MKVNKNRLLVKVQNDKAYIDTIMCGDTELYFAGHLKAEKNANSVAVVYNSGVDDISEGEVIGISYQAMSDYSWKGSGTHKVRVWNNRFETDEGVFFVIHKRDVICRIKGNEFDAYGNYVLLEHLEPEKSVNGVHVDLSVQTVDMRIVKPERARFVSGNIPAETGDIIVFKETMRQCYTFNKQPFAVLFTDNCQAVIK